MTNTEQCAATTNTKHEVRTALVTSIEAEQINVGSYGDPDATMPGMITITATCDRLCVTWRTWHQGPPIGAEVQVLVAWDEPS